MVDMKQAIIENWPMLAIVLPIIIFLFVEWRRGKKDLVWKIIFALVCQAEQQFGSGTGPAKLALVWSNLYTRLPFWLRLVFPKGVLDKYIEEAVQCLTRELKNPDFNLMTYMQEIEKFIEDKVTLPSGPNGFDDNGPGV